MSSIAPTSTPVLRKWRGLADAIDASPDTVRRWHRQGHFKGATDRRGNPVIWFEGRIPHARRSAFLQWHRQFDAARKRQQREEQEARAGSKRAPSKKKRSAKRRASK